MTQSCQSSSSWKMLPFRTEWLLRVKTPAKPVRDWLHLALKMCKECVKHDDNHNGRWLPSLSSPLTPLMHRLAWQVTWRTLNWQAETQAEHFQYGGQVDTSCHLTHSIRFLPVYNFCACVRLVYVCLLFHETMAVDAEVNNDFLALLWIFLNLHSDQLYIYSYYQHGSKIDTGMWWWQKHEFELAPDVFRELQLGVDDSHVETIYVNAQDLAKCCWVKSAQSQSWIEKR